MATDFWSSSHNNQWIVDHATLTQARFDDLQYASQREIALITIFFGNVISRLGKQLKFRQQVIATATVYFRRFYLQSSYCETDPFFVVTACCYLAAKSEETPVNLKSIVAEARTLFSCVWGVRSIPADTSKLAEMEFYLLEDLDFHLIVFHPYRSLVSLCARYDTIDAGEAGEVGFESPEERFWGTGEGKLDLEDGCMQMAWFIINDTYRSELCLLYPPYLLAITALYLACVLDTTTHKTITESSQPQTTEPRYSFRQAPSNQPTPASSRSQIIDFIAGINVSLELIAYISQQIISMYVLWDTISDGTEMDKSRRQNRREANLAPLGMTETEDKTILEKDIVALLLRMREQREQDLSHPAAARPVPVNRILERAQEAG